MYHKEKHALTVALHDIFSYIYYDEYYTHMQHNQFYNTFAHVDFVTIQPNSSFYAILFLYSRPGILKSGPLLQSLALTLIKLSMLINVFKIIKKNHM